MSDDFTRGYREGYREGYRDGKADADKSRVPHPPMTPVDPNPWKQPEPNPTPWDLTNRWKCPVCNINPGSHYCCMNPGCPSRVVC